MKTDSTDTWTFSEDFDFTIKFNSRHSHVEEWRKKRFDRLCRHHRYGRRRHNIIHDRSHNHHIKSKYRPINGKKF